MPCYIAWHIAPQESPMPCPAQADGTAQMGLRYHIALDGLAVEKSTQRGLVKKFNKNV
jgi:hypothetical protein